MINFDDAPRRSRGQDLPPRPDDAPDATEEQARNLWKLLVEGGLKGHRLRVGNTLRRGGQRGSAGSNAEFEFVEGQVPVSTGSGRRRSSFDPRRYNLKIVADAMRGEKARAIALDNLRFVMDETTGKLYLPWATKEGEARSHNAIPRDLRRYAKDALYTTSGGNTGVRHFYPPGYGPLDDEDAPESRQPKAPVSELRGERGKKRLQDWWDAGGGTPGVTARLRDFSENSLARILFAESEEKRSLFITFELPDYIAEKYPKGSRGAASAAAGGASSKPADKAKPHVTVLYCGKQTTDAAEKARKVAIEVMKEQEGFDIQGSGVDHFTGCEDEGKTDAVYTPITGGVTKLTELREKLAKALRDAGVEWTDTHPEYKPHVTIKYVPKGDADTVDPIEPWTAHVHFLHVNHGDSHRPVYLKQSFKVPFSESASGGQQFRHPQQAFGIRSIPPTASAYLDRLRQWRTPGSDVEPPDMPVEELGEVDAQRNYEAQRRRTGDNIYRGRYLRIPHGGLDYDPSEMSDRVPTDAEKREIVGPNIMDTRMARIPSNLPPHVREMLSQYELERPSKSDNDEYYKRHAAWQANPTKLPQPEPPMLERHNLRYPSIPAQQEDRVNVPGSATDLRTRLLEMELNDPSVPHDALARSREAWRWSPNPGVGSASYLSPTDEYASEYGVAQGSSDISKALAQRTGDAYGTPDEIDAMALFRALAAKHGTSPHGSMAAQIGDTIRRNISRHRFARQPQQFGRSMGYAVDVPEQAFARETHPMLQMAIDRSLQRPHRSSMPPEIGHPRSPLEYTGAGPVVVRSAPQDLTPEAFGPGNHIVTGEMPISRRRPNFQPIREPRFNPDAAHDEVVRLMLGRLPRRRYNGKPDEPWVVRANDEWNSDPTTFQRYQQAFAVDDDPNSPRRVWQTPPVVKPQAPQKPATPSKPEGQDIQNARVLARHYARPAIQPSTPKEPGFGKPSARQGEGLSEDWIKNFVKRGDDQSNEFAPPWMRGAGYDAPWNRGRGPENIGENLFPIAPTPRMIDDRQPSLAPYRSGSRLDGGYLPRVRSVVNRAAIGGQPRSLGSVLGGAARGAWRGGTSGLGTSLGNIGLGLAGTLLGLGTQNLGTIGHGLLGIGSGALGIAGTPLRAVGGAGLGAAGYDPASWSTKRWGYKPWKVQQRQPEDDQEAPWANAPERKFSRQSQQGFSILRPDETGAGRGLGSAYPRVSTGRYGETNVEYDPTIAARQGENRDQRWLETRSIGGKIHRHPYNPAEDVSDNSGEQIDNYWETGFNKYPHMVAKHVAENLPTDTAGALLRAELRNPSRGVSRSDIQGRLIKLAPRMRISENRRDDLGDVIESNGGLREFIRSSPIVEMIGEWLRDVNHGEGNPLSAAGIQRPGRGPGRGGGPRFSRHDHEFAAPGGAPNRVMFPSDDGSAQPGQYANAGLQTQQMRSVFGPQSSLQTTRPPFTQAAQAGGTILVTPTGGIMGVVVPPRTIPVSPTTMQPIRPQPSTRWEKPRQFARHDHEFSASGVAGQFAPNVPAMPRMNRQTFNPQPPQQEPIVDWLQALRGTGAPRPMPQQQIQRPRPKPRPSAAEEFWPRVMPFARSGNAPDLPEMPSIYNAPADVPDAELPVMQNGGRLNNLRHILGVTESRKGQELYNERGELNPLRLSKMRDNAKLDAIGSMIGDPVRLRNGRTRPAEGRILDMLSGYTCSGGDKTGGADRCQTVATDTGYRTPAGNMQMTVRDVPGSDDPNCASAGSPADRFRCYAANQEGQRIGLFNRRIFNTRLIHHIQTMPGLSDREKQAKIADLLTSSIDPNTPLLRFHTGGDFLTKNYFDALLQAAEKMPKTRVYGYTKKLPFLVDAIKDKRIPPNVQITASKGGKRDDLIDQHGLPYAEVVRSLEEAQQKHLPLDVEDLQALVGPALRGNQPGFGLLIHGTQASGEAAQAAVNTHSLTKPELTAQELAKLVALIKQQQQGSDVARQMTAINDARLARGGKLWTRGKRWGQFARQPQQGFSILRPDETGKGRGLGSMYPRVSTGRYGETNVEYDPTIKPIDLPTRLVDWAERLREIQHSDTAGENVSAWVGKMGRVAEDYGHVTPSEPAISILRLGSGIPSDTLERAGIQRPGRGPGRGGGPRFMAQHSFSIGASAPSATTLNHFHPSIRRSTKRRMFEVC